MNTTTTKHYDALQATINQLVRWLNDGNDSIYFGALSDHPESDEDTTFGDLIPQAFEQYEQSISKQAFADSHIEAQRNQLAEVTAQRDELLAALKDLRNRVVAEKPDCLNTTKADAVISKAEQH